MNIGGKRVPRSSIEVHLNKPSSTQTLLHSSKNGSFPDLTSSDTSTNSSNIGDFRMMATAAHARTGVPPIRSLEAPISPMRHANSSSSLNRLGDSWRSGTTEVSGKQSLGMDFSSPPIPVGSRRMLMRRASSVPNDIAGSRPLRRRGTTRPSNGKAPVLLNGHDNDGEDDSIDESWRPSADKRRILQESLTPEGQLGTKSSLDNFLDSLIFDSKNKRWYGPNPSQSHRKRHIRPRQKSSTQSVGSALDRRRGSGDKLRSYSGSGAATISVEAMSFPSSTGSSPSGSPSATMSPEKASPISWSRKGRRRGQPPVANDQQGPIITGGGLASGLSAFLEQEARHARLTSAHTISGDPRAGSADDTVSIALSDTDGTMTYTIGAPEARVIKSLLQTSQHEKSPSKDDMKDWLEKAALTLQSPPVSAHDKTVASDIAESDRISSRSSLMVESSPPPFNGKSDLRTYLDNRRSRDKRSSAFTVAGDRVSSRFQGKSTQELLELIESEKKQMKAINDGPRLVGVSRGRSATISGANHIRGGLERMTSVPNLGSTDRFAPDAGEDEADDLQDTGRIERTSDHIIREDLGSFLDRKSPKNVPRSSGAYSAPGDRADHRHVDRSRRRQNSPRLRSSSHGRASSAPRSQRDSMITPDSAFNKEMDLEEFRPPSSARPTNRRTMMRKMPSVPVLIVTDTNLQQPQMKPGHSSPIPRRRHRSRHARKTRSESPRRRKKSNDGNNSDTGSRVSRTGRRGRRKRVPKAEKDQLMVDDMSKSFLDKYLDGDVEAHDSASQIASHQNQKEMLSKEQYKASLHTTPIENSSNKLRIEPELLESSQRIMLQDPTAPNRRDGLKKIQSVPIMSTPSPALKDLYEPVILVDEKLPKSPKKGANKPGKKKKKGGKKQKENSKKETKAPKPVEATLLDVDAALDRITLKDLPRFRESQHGDAEDQKLRNRRENLQKVKSCSNLDRRAYDVADRLLLVKRLKALTNDAPPSPSEESLDPQKPLSERITSSEKTPTRGRGDFTPNSRKAKSKLQAPKSAPGRRTLRGSNARWSSVPGGLGAGLVAKPKRSSVDPDGIAPRAGKIGRHQGIPSLPFDSFSSSSHKDFDSSERTHALAAPPSKPKRKTSKNPGEAFQDESKRWTKISPSKPSPKKKKKNKYKSSRPIPTTIGEGSILECSQEDNTVCSDITDGFSLESWEVEQYRAAKRKTDLRRINEEEQEKSSSHRRRGKLGDSWGDLSHSDNVSKVSNVSKDRNLHLSKRWQSTPNLKVDSDILKTPVRGSTEPAAEKKRFGWLKKLTFGKK